MYSKEREKMKLKIIENYEEEIKKNPLEFEITENSFSKIVDMRPVDAEPEAHRDWTDVYIVLEGDAVLITGDRLQNFGEIEDGEYRGGEIVNPEVTHLKKGSIAVIPNGMPHKLKVNNNLRQIVIKIKD
jgi:beta-galactosidase beta subunit